MDVLTGRLSGAPNTNNYENLTNKPMINGIELSGNKTAEELGLGSGGSDMPVGDFVSREELQTLLQDMVTASQFETALSEKANLSTMNRALGLKADSKAVEQALAEKIDAETVNAAGYQTAEQVAAAVKSVESKIPDLSEVQQALTDLENQFNALVNGNEVAY